VDRPSPFRFGRLSDRIRAAVLMIAIAGLPAARGVTVGSINVRFKRVVAKPSSTELAAGAIFFRSPNRVLLRVDSAATLDRTVADPTDPALDTLLRPLNQWMWFRDSSLLIFYPDEGRAFDIRSPSPFLLPFFQAFVGIVQEDFGLARLGFVLDKSENRGETLLTHWLPPKELQKQLSEIRLALVDDRLTSAETRDARGKPLVRTDYGGYVEHDGAWFPLSVASFEYGKSGTTHEQVSYADPRFNLELPDSILNFELPAGTKLDTVRW
jgi:hypothetical protein